MNNNHTLIGNRYKIVADLFTNIMDGRDDRVLTGWAGLSLVHGMKGLLEDNIDLRIGNVKEATQSIIDWWISRRIEVIVKNSRATVIIPIPDDDKLYIDIVGGNIDNARRVKRSGIVSYDIWKLLEIEIEKYRRYKRVKNIHTTVMILLNYYNILDKYTKKFVIEKLKSIGLNEIDESIMMCDNINGENQYLRDRFIAMCYELGL